MKEVMSSVTITLTKALPLQSDSMPMRMRLWRRNHYRKSDTIAAIYTEQMISPLAEYKEIYRIKWSALTNLVRPYVIIFHFHLKKKLLKASEEAAVYELGDFLKE